MTKIRITDTTFRDGHQGLLATRLRTSDMEPIAAEMGSTGFHSMEVWGGATFDVATRFLAEDPWERLQTFKRLIPTTPLMMLLRGQSLVGYRQYANDIVEEFVRLAAESGIDIFRVFDALNDPNNLATAAKAIKSSGAHLQMTICYSISENGRLGGPIYNMDYYTNKAMLFQDMGADSIAIKDMAGLLSPYDSYNLVKTLKNVLRVPLQLHCHYTSGMASMSYLKAIEAGVDVVDTCLAPLALRTSQPSVESLVMSLNGTKRNPELDLNRLIGMGDYLETILPKYSSYMETPTTAVIDPRVLDHQIPGGMASNLSSQLRDADALDRLPDVLEEIPKTRKELGYPPLVTPISQMVGAQAVNNVLFGRYKIVSESVKDYVLGRYGQPPGSLDPNIVAVITGTGSTANSSTDQSPINTLEPELDKAIEGVKDFTTDIHDVITYALYPTTGMSFLRMKHGLDPVPETMAPPSPTIQKDQSIPKSAQTRSFNIYVGEDYYQVEVDPVEVEQQVEVDPVEVEQQVEVENGPQRSGPPEPELTSEVEDKNITGEKPEPLPKTPSKATLTAPMPGLVLRYEVEIGQTIDQEETLLVLEAMKMEISVPSPAKGTVEALPCEIGSSVARGDLLAVIAT